MDEMHVNFQWFLDHYMEIYSLCGECYVIIKEQRIIRIFSNEKEAYDWIVDNSLLGKCNIQYCNGKESGYTTYF